MFEKEKYSKSDFTAIFWLNTRKPATRRLGGKSFQGGNTATYGPSHSDKLNIARLTIHGRKQVAIALNISMQLRQQIKAKYEKEINKINNFALIRKYY